VHHILEVGVHLQGPGQPAWRRVGLEREDGLGYDLGNDQRVGMLLVAQQP
jgi:hypothetical protein